MNKKYFKYHDVNIIDMFTAASFNYNNGINQEGYIKSEKIDSAIKNLIECNMHSIRSGADINKVSVCVLAGGADGHLISLLDSLTHQRDCTLSKIIVSQHYGSIENIDKISKIPWISIESKEKSLLDSLKRLAETSEYVLIIRQHERLSLYAVKEFIQALNTVQNVGCVGAKIIDCHGITIEAGGLCYSDIGLGMIGNKTNIDSPELCYSKKVNFFSGAFAIKGKLLKSLLKNPRIIKGEPYLFLDLFHEIERLGLSNWFVSTACSISSHNYFDLSHGAWNEISRSVLKISSTSAKYPEFYAIKMVGETTEQTSKRILYLDSFTPDHEADAGSVVCINVIKALINKGYNITFVPVENSSLDYRLSRILSRMGVEVYYGTDYTDIVHLFQKVGPKTDIVFGVRVTVIYPYLDALKKYLSHCPFMFLNADLHYIRELRTGEIKSDFKIIQQSSVTKKNEISCFKVADASFVHTVTEKEIVESEGVRNVSILPYATDINLSETKYEKRRNILFLGGYKHYPNTDAAIYFTKHVWPKLKPKLDADSKLFLVGSSPCKNILSLASEDIIVTGQVEDIRNYYEEARVFIAPLRFGAGVKGKVINSLANGVPIVATSIASEGIPMKHGIHYYNAETPSSFINGICTVYHNKKIWSKLQSNGYKLARKIASKESFENVVYQTIETAIQQWKLKINNQILH